MKIPASVTNAATVTVHVTHDEARRLPGMLGAMAPHELKARGYYAVTVGGVKTLYVLQVQCAHETSRRLDKETPFFHPVCEAGGRFQNMRDARYNEAAHGGIVTMDECFTCGAQRQVSVNGVHEELGPWSAPRAVEEAREKEHIAQQRQQLLAQARAILDAHNVKLVGRDSERETLLVEVGRAPREVSYLEARRAASSANSDDTLREIYLALVTEAGIR